MTKPVQIQRYSTRGYEDDFYPDDEGKWVTHADAEAREQAAISQALKEREDALRGVREMLEAKAKEWQDEICTRVDAMGNESNPKQDCASELLSLAATLGNQGK